ncbi:hypothetical protein ACIRF8_23960 [Streptomyces sp. NPDC102406]|uniref:hypothetical protein n=1 Tax=Streptomyces sp. NPDC102406 TaxID=3366171 RepID=UPI0038105CB3
MTEFMRLGRLFRVVGFTTTHRQLFLSSPAELMDGISTQIDVHIGHVRLMLLTPYYRNGVHIRRAGPEQFAMLSERHGLKPDDEAYTWMLAPDDDSFVVASPPDWREAEHALMGDRESLYDGPWPDDLPMESGNLL